MAEIIPFLVDGAVAVRRRMNVDGDIYSEATLRAGVRSEDACAYFPPTRELLLSTAPLFLSLSLPFSALEK